MALSQIRMTPAPTREAPAPLPLHCGLDDPSHPSVPDEPILATDEIQGNILGGFSKDQQTLLGLRIDSVADFKAWLQLLVPFVATSAEVIAFNRLFKAMRFRRGTERNTVKATWINIAFSAQGLRQLTTDVDDFKDGAFKDGLATRSPDLGDPTDAADEGNPTNWVLGGPGNEADVLLIVASDDPNDLAAEVNRLRTSLTGATVIFQEDGANLPGDLAGHEHFGFLDGVSQPGLRGRLSDDPHDVLTPRQNPNNRDQGKPGQDLLWPGEFVFGYPGQDPKAADISEPGSLSQGGPDWATNGSFLVFRRLRQDVGAFHQFLQDTAASLGVPDPDHASGARLVGSRCVGRWPSGAPVLRSPDDENPDLAADDCANNNFEFQEETDPIPPTGFTSPFDCTDDVFDQSQGDKEGLQCPFTGHIRKAYPRDDTSNDKSDMPDVADCHSRRDLGEVNTQTHRLLRRGIPFGEVSASTPEAPVNDTIDRGLHFLAYQTSIEDQFEFVTRCWVNNPDFKEPFGQSTADPITRGGHDPIIGQNNTPGENRRREFTVTFPDAGGVVQHRRVDTTTDWVIPTGGGYFFAPSISVLEMLSTQNVAIRSAQFMDVHLRMDGSGVTAFSGPGGGTVNCQFGIGAWERFRLEPQADGTVAIASLAFPGVYLRMDGNGVTAFSGPGGGTVNCQFGVGAWERFRLEPQADGTVAIASAAFPGVYLRMDGNGVTAFSGPGAGTVNCQFGVGAWERFQLETA